MSLFKYLHGWSKELIVFRGPFFEKGPKRSMVCIAKSTRKCLAFAEAEGWLGIKDLEEFNAAFLAK